MVLRRAARSHRFDHGFHTLRSQRGVIVGTHGDDVFVELGVRMQGVISRRRFASPPALGESHEFTLRGIEEGLWVLELGRGAALSTWENLETKSVVHARVVRPCEGGLEVKIGPLHAFLPKSHTGLAREESPAQLIGKTLACEVLEVDAHKERVIVSRKLVKQRERESLHARAVSALRAGDLVTGRVVRIEPYGAFVRFGRGMEGLIHVRNLSHERVEHPRERLAMGDLVEAKVLYVRERGRRIALGMKQLAKSPFSEFAACHREDEIVPGRVTRVVEFGAFVELVRGLEGLVHRSEAGVAREVPLGRAFAPGQRVSARIRHLDHERERVSLSLCFSDGVPIGADEAEARSSSAAHLAGDREALCGTSLGPRMEEALRRLLARRGSALEPA